MLWPNEECSISGDVERLNADGTRSPMGFTACIAEYHGNGLTKIVDEVETEYTTIELALMPAAGKGRVRDPGSRWLTLIIVLEQTLWPAPPGPSYRYPLGAWSAANSAQSTYREPLDVQALKAYGTSYSEAVGYGRPKATNLEGELGTENFAFEIVAPDGKPDYGKLTIDLNFAGVELPADSTGARTQLSGEVIIEANKPEPAGGGNGGCTGACGTKFSCKAADTATALGVCIDYEVMDAARAATLKGKCVSPATLLSGNCASAGVTGPNSCHHTASNGDKTCTYSSFTREKCTSTDGVPDCTGP